MTSDTISWRAVTPIDPARHTRARLDLHWAAQVVAGFANAVLPQTEDDGRDNLGWQDDARELMTRAAPGDGIAAGLAVASATIRLHEATMHELAIEGQTLAELRAWMAERADVVIQLRDYDMPEHEVSNGAPFGAAGPAHAALATWIANAFVVLHALELDLSTSEARLWPHHFDVGRLSLLDPELGPEVSRSIGFGWSPGDTLSADPYFYVSPYPRVESTGSMPALPNGRWGAEGFTGAILTASEIAAHDDTDEQHAAAVGFLLAAIKASREHLDAL